MTGKDAADTPISLREALRGIWPADKYPIRGNEDWREAKRLDAAAARSACRHRRRAAARIAPPAAPQAG